MLLELITRIIIGAFIGGLIGFYYGVFLLIPGWEKYRPFAIPRGLRVAGGNKAIVMIGMRAGVISAMVAVLIL